VTNRAGTFGWFGMNAAPGQIVKVDLSDLGQMKKIQTIELSDGEDYPHAAVIDGAERYGYFGTDTIPARIVKVDLDTMTQVDALTLPPGEDRLYTAITNPEGTVAYFGTLTEPASVIRIDLETFERTGSLPLPAIEPNLVSSVADASGEFGYFGCGVVPGRVVKWIFGTFPESTACLLRGSKHPSHGIIEPTGLFAYFGISIPAGRSGICRFQSVRRFDIARRGGAKPVDERGALRLCRPYGWAVARIDLVTFTYQESYLAGSLHGGP
jgi:hypothetical protein